MGASVACGVMDSSLHYRIARGGSVAAQLLVVGVSEIPKRLKLSPFVRAVLVRSVYELETHFKSDDVFGVLLYGNRFDEVLVQKLQFMSKKYPRRHFILCSQEIDKSSKNIIYKSPNLHFFWGSEESQINYLLSKISQKQQFHPRKAERTAVSAPVMVKASQIAVDSPVGSRLKAIVEGNFVDFSKYGAKIVLSAAAMSVKDYICVMYQKANGQWVSVESQVRWSERDDVSGKYYYGLQFIACL
ncbi:MAG: PilZ domain-containing protein [Bdellovibrionia bacterium]